MQYPPEMEHILRGALQRRYGDDVSSPEAQEALRGIRDGDNSIVSTLMQEGEAGSPQTGMAGTAQLGLALGSLAPMGWGLAKKVVPALAKLHPLGRGASMAASLGNLGLTGYGGYNIYDAIKREQLDLPGTGEQAAWGALDLGFPAVAAGSKLARRAGSTAASKFPGLRRKALDGDTSLDDPSGGIWRWLTGGDFKPKADFESVTPGRPTSMGEETWAKHSTKHREAAEKLQEESKARVQSGEVKDPDIEYRVNRRTGKQEPVFKNLEEARAYDRTSREVRDPRTGQVYEEGRQSQRTATGEPAPDPGATTAASEKWSGTQGPKDPDSIDKVPYWKVGGGRQRGPATTGAMPEEGMAGQGVFKSDTGDTWRPLDTTPGTAKVTGAEEVMPDIRESGKTGRGHFPPRDPEEVILSGRASDVAEVEAIYRATNFDDVNPSKALDNFEDLHDLIQDPRKAANLPIEEATRQEIATIHDELVSDIHRNADAVIEGKEQIRILEGQFDPSKVTDANANLIKEIKKIEANVEAAEEAVHQGERDLVKKLKGLTKKIRSQIAPDPKDLSTTQQTRRTFEGLFNPPKPPATPAPATPAPTPVTFKGKGGWTEPVKRRKPSNQMNLFGPEVPLEGTDFQAAQAVKRRRRRTV
jgi:hypothetical protein